MVVKFARQNNSKCFYCAIINVYIYQTIIPAFLIGEYLIKILHGIDTV